jgi:uncharacterized protein (TIGR02246 family)
MIQKIPMFATADAVEEAFYDALEAGDVETLMQLWCEEEEIVCIHPSGHRLTGHSAIRASMDEILEGGGLDIRVSDIRVHQSATIAVHHLTERITVDGEQGQQLVTLAATNVYLKGPVGWQLYLHQATPIAAQDASPAPPGPLLH